MTLKQRSEQWRALRLGDVTSSRFKDVLTKATPKGLFAVHGKRGAYYVTEAGEIVSGDFDRKADADDKRKELSAEWGKANWSQTALSYMIELSGALKRGVTHDILDTPATRHGNEHEAAAREKAAVIIQARTGMDLQEPVDDTAYMPHHSEPYIGCSPDGLIGDDHLWECKCPYNPTVHDKTVRAGVMPDGHVAQVQGSLWCTGRQFYIFTSYDPRLEGTKHSDEAMFLVRVERNDDYIDNVLAPRIIAFRDMLRAEYESSVEAPF